MTHSIIAQNYFKYNKPSGKRLVKRKIILAVCGVFIGIVNGLFGAGGGMLVVPVLTFVAGLDEKKSHATAIAIILPLCFVSSIVYALRGGYDYSVFPPTIIGVILGGVVGAMILKIASNNVLPFFFYGLMLFAGIKMLI